MKNKLPNFLIVGAAKSGTSSLHNYLNHHEIDKCFLIGHSMGGKTAMNFSMLHAEYLKKLINKKRFS